MGKKFKKIYKTYTYKISDITKEEMIEYFKYKKREKTPPYAIFQADEDDTVVTLYESNKVVFQGISADIDASIWSQREKKLTGHFPQQTKQEQKKPKITEVDKTDYYYISSVGSDEVGTGDYFGPIVVTASFVSKDDVNFLEALGVRDSKKLLDDKIIKIAPTLIEKIPHVTAILSNKKYNEMFRSGINMNGVKAIMHNKVLYELMTKNKYDYDKIVVDQFVNADKYYEYLERERTVVKNISFTTQAEDKCLSVACSSIISRYIFLNEMDKLGKKLGYKLLLGAGYDVDEVGKNIVEKYNIDKLEECAKINFKNTQKIRELLNK